MIHVAILGIYVRRKKDMTNVMVFVRSKIVGLVNVLIMGTKMDFTKVLAILTINVPTLSVLWIVAYGMKKKSQTDFTTN